MWLVLFGVCSGGFVGRGEFGGCVGFFGLLFLGVVGRLFLVGVFGGYCLEFIFGGC